MENGINELSELNDAVKINITAEQTFILGYRTSPDPIPDQSSDISLNRSPSSDLSPDQPSDKTSEEYFNSDKSSYKPSYEKSDSK